MVVVYSIVLGAGMLGLLAWIVARALAVNVERHGLDPEVRFGLRGRRVVAALVGMGIGGMSAEFSPLDLSWPVAMVLALAGAAAAAWMAGWIDADEGSQEPV